MARILRRHIFVCFVVFDSWGFGKFARTHMERMGSSERERSRIAWSNLVGECPSTGFLSAAFASLCDMVGMREMVFDFFFALRSMLCGAEHSSDWVVCIYHEAIASGAVGAWFASQRIQGIGCQGHCWIGSSGQGA